MTATRRAYLAHTRTDIELQSTVDVNVIFALQMGWVHIDVDDFYPTMDTILS
ncbi:hypothetical protein KKI90_11580 [Xenorhabdus bovienii]|uniref:hypothetical protein n=1 Tax=Xenorhabdus bovienii TaxID=40576 RepID=UPI00237CDE35|nr:hypothetical protein [Xenorhabdus bovienii]MDE1487093.1 hypothetical protein [Xenorhabdus bovienii]MDE9477861.1 hypothetical protein [Xenorhabdus bovienii]MDE9530752.1 hypothetical protein [Xenorhabdus bovienii]